MGILNKLKERLSGNRLSRSRTLAPRTRHAIEQGLREGNFDAPAADYLRAHLPFLINKKRVGDLAVFCGSSRARKILGLKKEDTDQDPKVFYEKITAWKKDGIFDFNGILIVEPRNQSDAELLATEFMDIILPALIGKEHYDIFRGLGLEGPYEAYDVKLESGDIVIDAGANMGLFSSVAARVGCHVLAFEPSRHIRESYLEKNAQLNGNIEILPYALSDRREELQFIIDEENIGASRRSEDMQNGNADTTMAETVQAVTLDEIIADRGMDRVDFIKADIEGSERRLLLGAKNILKKFAPKLSLCTYHLPDDPTVMKKIILECQPKYKIVQRECKLYATV